MVEKIAIDKPQQLVAVVLAPYGDAAYFLDNAHRSGHDAFIDSVPEQALKLLRAQMLYGSVNAVVVDIGMLGTIRRTDTIKDFLSKARNAAKGVPIIVYSSRQRRERQLRSLARDGEVDGVLVQRQITPDEVLNSYPTVVHQRVAA